MAFSTILGMSLARYGDESSRQGLVLTSMSHGFNSSSIMKSYPNIYLKKFLVFEKLIGRLLQMNNVFCEDQFFWRQP
jgi:hypothetical protein